MKTLNPVTKAKIDDYYAGLFLSDIAKKYGVSRQSVDSLLKAHKVVFRPNMDVRNPAELVSFNCEECGKPNVKKYFVSSKNKYKFCNKECKKPFTARNQPTLEEKRERNRVRINKYRATSRGLENCETSRLKYLRSEKYLDWYERFYGHRKGTQGSGKPRVNKLQPCLVKGCTKFTYKKRKCRNSILKR